jgi:hypothetical protein
MTVVAVNDHYAMLQFSITLRYIIIIIVVVVNMTINPLKSRERERWEG